MGEVAKMLKYLILAALIIGSIFLIISHVPTPSLKPGDKAPDFTLKDQHGKEHSLSDYKGKNLLIFFYPIDNSPT